MYSDPEVAVSTKHSSRTGISDPAEVLQSVEFQEPSSGLCFRSVVPDIQTRIWARLALLHGYGDHGGRYGHVLNWFAARGISCSAMDFRGQGRSEGRRGFIWRWQEYLDDVDTFLAWERGQSALSNNGSPPPLFVMGHSHGGLVAAAAGISGRLKSDSEIACILSSPYLRAARPLSRPWQAIAWALDHILPWKLVNSGLSAAMMTSDAAMQAEAIADPLLIHGATPRWYVETIGVQVRVMRDAGMFKLPLLCLIGDADPIADPAAVEEFVRSAGSADKTLRRFPGALHELLRESNREAVFATVYDWMSARVERASSS